MYDEHYTDYQTDRSRLRRFVRRAYLRHQAGLVRGATVDFGCGVGELLSRLPDGSMGFEVNEATVTYCRARGLDVRQYDPTTDQYQLRDLAEGQFTSLICAHVLEHLDDPIDTLKSLLAASVRLQIKRVVAIVPGELGFSSDDTHRTLVSADDLQAVDGTSGYSLTSLRWFPIDTPRLSTRFTHHELTAVFDRP